MLTGSGPGFFLTLSVVALSACMTPPATAAPAGQEAPLRLGPGPHLFVDDYLVATSVGLTRTTHQPVKLPEPVFQKGESWHLQPQWFMKVAYDGKAGSFRAWYNVKNPGGAPNVCYAYAESKDGATWVRPNLGLVDVGGSTQNNLLAAPQGYFGLFLVDDGPDFAEPARRFKLGYFGEGLRVAFSADGFRFAEYPGNPVIAERANAVPYYAPGYENIISDIIDGCWDPLRKEYLLGCKIEHGGYPGKPHYHAQGWRRCVGMSTSKDFITWEKPRLIVTPDPNNGMEEFYGFKPMLRGDLYLGFLRVLRDDLAADPDGPANGIGWTELLTSRDGRTWTRYQEKFIDRSPVAGSWDHAMAWFADCVTVGDKDYVYYGGYSAGHKVGDRQVGLAFLRQNGFVSRDAGAGKGTLRTPTVLLGGDGMTVNASVTGSLRVRITDPDGTARPGFDWADGSPIRGDAVAHAVSWTGAFTRLANQPVRLEFELCEGELYGFDLVGP
jgi:hypothetical protein